MLTSMTIFGIQTTSVDPDQTTHRRAVRDWSPLFAAERLEPPHEISNNMVYATSKGSDQPAHMRSLTRAFARRLSFL